MSDTPKIPYGYKRVFGHSQKGDGILADGKFRKVKKEYPFIREDMVVIRRCEVVQQKLPVEEPLDFTEAEP